MLERTRPMARLDVPGGDPSIGPPARGPRLPNFLVIGAMKAGTTSLFHYLRTHPGIHMSPLKEVDFFAEEGNWSRGPDWYRKQFASAPPEATALGEASTVYSKYPHYRGVPGRIAGLIPEARVIYVVRDPIQRIRSHYQHRVAVGAETAPIDEAVFTNPIYLDYSRYALQVEQYLEHFDNEQMLVITSEALRADRLRTIQGVFTFLGVDADHVPETLDTEYYRTQERARYSPAAWRLRRTLRRYVPATKRAKEFVDSRLPQLRDRLLGRTERSAGPGEHPAVIPDDLRTKLTDELAEDVSRLRAYLPPTFDGWGIG
jgi:hypothetical protein